MDIIKVSLIVGLKNKKKKWSQEAARKMKIKYEPQRFRIIHLGDKKIKCSQ